jgi:DNA-binding SARP family transcriptional activator
MVSDWVEFRILGPLQVLVGDRQVALTSASQRALLAALLLRANQAVATVRLIDDLWAQTPPARADVALRMAVSRLRRVLSAAGPAGEELLVTRPGGYVLQIDPDQLDVHWFERLAAQGHQALASGQAELAAERLGAALGLWRGPLLADVDTMAVVTAEANRLEHLRLAALQARIDADQALGRHAQALADLQALVADHPLDEGAADRLIRALARAGRQADALATYRRLRHRLVEELGIEPSPPLQQLEQAILVGDPDLQPTTPSPSGAVAAPTPPAELPPTIAGFTGRDQELAWLDQALAAAGQPGPTVVCAIQGPGGVGKSALAIHAAHRNADRFPDGQLYVNLQGATPGLQPLDPLEVLGRFLRSLGQDPAQIPTDVQEAAGRFRSLVEGRRLLVVLDNAHDAAQIRPLIPGTPACATLTTSRQTLAALQNAHVLSLDVLPFPEATELLKWIVGHDRVSADPTAAAEVVECCGRLPLALQIAGARLAARPTWPVGELARCLGDTTSRLDELATGDLAVRASFDVSLRALHHSPDPTERAAVTAFGLLALPDGPHLSMAAAARLLDLPERAARAQVERLVDAHLLETPGPGRYQFHDLLRLYARDHATRLRQQSRRQRLAALTRLIGFYTATAWHTLTLLRPGDYRLATADPRWTSGGLKFDDAPAALAWLEAERPNLLAAVNQAATSPGIRGELAGQLAHAIFPFLLVRGYWQDSVQATQTALHIARQMGDLAAQAQAYNNLGGAQIRLGQFAEALDHHQESLAIRRKLGDRRGQGASLSNLGLIHERHGRYEEAMACQQESLAILRELGDRRGQAATLGNLGVVYQRQGRYEEAMACQQESLAIFRELGDRLGHAESLNDLGVVYQRHGQYGRALACHQESVAIFRELGDRYGQAEALRDLGAALVSAGHHQRARTAWQEALATFDQLGVPEADDLRARLAAHSERDPRSGGQ